MVEAGVDEGAVVEQLGLGGLVVGVDGQGLVVEAQGVLVLAGLEGLVAGLLGPQQRARLLELAAAAVVVGVAAQQSIETGQAVDIDSLINIQDLN